MKSSLITLLVAAGLVTACGGTDPTKETANHISITGSENTTLLAGESISLTAKAYSSPAPITKMSWTYSKSSGGTDFVLSNADCANKSINNNASTLDPSSTWECSLPITAPVGLVADAQYKFTVAVTDNKNNTSSRDLNVTVKPNNTPPPSVSIVSVDTMDSGKTITLKCSASGGVSKSGKYTYQWVNNAVDEGFKLNFTSQIADEATFTAPSVLKLTNASLSCRATDDNSKTGVSTKIIKVNPMTNATIIPRVADGFTIPSGATIKLYGEGSLWESGSTGVLSPQPPIYYLWSQISGPKTQLFDINSSTPTVSFPSITSNNGIKKETYIFTMSVSDKPFIGGISSGNTQTINAYYIVNYLDPITAVSPTPLSFVGNTAASATINAVGAAGQKIYYSWTQISGPQVTLAGWNTSTASFLAPSVVGTQNIAIILRVAMDYSPITPDNSNATFVDLLVTITPNK